MKPHAALAAVAALTVAVATAFAPAFAARGSYVVDDAHLLSPAAIAQINQQVGDFNAQTGKEVLVVTTDSLGGTAPDAAIERSFAQNQVNGVEIFIAKSEHSIRIAGDKASSRFFPSGSYQTIAQTMRASFKAGDYDGGVENAVGVVINTYRGHASSLNRGRQPAGQRMNAPVQHSSSGGFS
ncbi:MAG TPA: TPM domain-containing protein, partial [Candidatus Elarobacter sp.]